MQGRIVIITGAAGGVGQTVTKAWIDAGASVLAVDAHERGHEALSAFVGETDRLRTHVADLTTEDGAKSMVEAARAGFGVPDTLIHLVGGFGMGSIASDDAPETWRRMMAINLDAAFHSFRAMVPAFRERGGGWIVGMSSKTVTAPPAQLAAYAASKAGLVALSHSMSEELKGEGVHVNLIVASTVDTPANRAAMGEKSAEKWVRAEDVADATMYLCSEKGRAVFGATLEVFALS